jgi:hypothetical protein
MAIALRCSASWLQPNAMAVALSAIASRISFNSATKKVIDYVSIIDSFDAVEQMLGYSLDAYDGYRVDGNIVTV